jgi:isopentenyldiphosphate isomerase
VSDPGAELVDVVDGDGRPIRRVTRREMRAQRLPHRCTYVLVFDSAGRLFVHQRTDTKDVFPSRWDMTIGGVLAPGEDFDTGARRELAEELGVTAALERLFDVRFPAERPQVFGMAYRCRHDGPFQLQPEEIVRGEFMSAAELDAALARERFCPDGLAVFTTFRERFPEDFACGS